MPKKKSEKVKKGERSKDTKDSSLYCFLSSLPFPPPNMGSQRRLFYLNNSCAN